jgi:hypothetical protein
VKNKFLEESFPCCSQQVDKLNFNLKLWKYFGNAFQQIDKNTDEIIMPEECQPLKAGRMEIK